MRLVSGMALESVTGCRSGVVQQGAWSVGIRRALKGQAFCSRQQRGRRHLHTSIPPSAIGGLLHGRDKAAAAAGNEKDSTRPTDPPFNKDSRIAIVGGGSAGLTMAYQLQKRGYQKVTVYEKDTRVGGMTYTKWDTAPAVDHNVLATAPEIRVVPHEMGACYLTAIRHRYIIDLMEELYLGTVPMPSMEVYSGVPSEPTMHFEDWMQTQYSGLKSKLSKWANLSDEQKAELFLGQLNSYFEHRNKLLGDDDYYLFPRDRPSKEVLKELQMPFKDWLQHHKLDLILPLFYETQTSQGYGYLEEVPAYYGLIWNSKELFSYIRLPKLNFLNFLSTTALEKIVDKLDYLPKRVQHQVKRQTDQEPRATATATMPEAEGDAAEGVQKLQKSFRAVMVQGGFSSIWERLVQRLPNVHTGVNIVGIERHLDQPSRPVTVSYTQGCDEVVSAPHDYLMLACKLDDIAWLKDVQPDEKAIFDDIHNYELTTTLVSIPANPANKIPQSPHMFLAGKLTSVKYLNKCYVTRTSLKCVAPGLSYGAGNFQTAQGNDIDRWAPDDDTRVCFQYSAIDSVPKDSAGYLTDDQLYAELVKDLKEYGAQDVQPHYDPQSPGRVLQKRWKYMPHFTGDNLSNLWGLWDLQDRHRTMYLGSVTCFESTADVYSYNMQLADWFQL